MVFSNHIWEGSSAQIAFSLLTISLFLGLVLFLKPYRDSNLTNFQACALSAQFLTVFASWCWLNKQQNDLLRQFKPEQGHDDVSEVLGGIIIFCNVAAITVLPMRR